MAFLSFRLFAERNLAERAAGFQSNYRLSQKIVLKLLQLGEGRDAWKYLQFQQLFQPLRPINALPILTGKFRFQS